MGTWDIGAFDNDTASDWSSELEETDGLALVGDAIEAVVETGGDYLDADLGAEALAACEVIARLKGNWGERDSYTETVDAWVEAHPIQPPDDLVEQAIQAIDRILATDSELLELWAESEDIEKWRASVIDLRARVVADVAT